MPYDVYSIYQSVHIGTKTLYVDCFLNTTIPYILIDIFQYVKSFFMRLQIFHNFFNIRRIIKLIKSLNCDTIIIGKYYLRIYAVVDEENI